jgi:hypothetical protein
MPRQKAGRATKATVLEIPGPGLEWKAMKQATEGLSHTDQLSSSEFPGHIRLPCLSVLLTKDSLAGPTASPAPKHEVIRKHSVCLDEAWVTWEVRRPAHQNCSKDADSLFY